MSQQLEQIQKAVFDGDEQLTVNLVNEALASGLSAQDIVDKGLVKGLHDCGAGYEAGEKFIPEMLMAAEAMKASMAILKSHLAVGQAGAGGKIVLATVQGDVHDIGLELVATMLGSSGFDINFMGPDVETSKIIEAVKADKPHISVCRPLTNTMDEMPVIIKNSNRKASANRSKCSLAAPLSLRISPTGSARTAMPMTQPPPCRFQEVEVGGFLNQSAWGTEQVRFPASRSSCFGRSLPGR